MGSQRPCPLHKCSLQARRSGQTCTGVKTQIKELQLSKHEPRQTRNGPQVCAALRNHHPELRCRASEKRDRDGGEGKVQLADSVVLEAAGIVKQRRPAQSSTTNARSGAGAAVTFTDLSKKKTEEVVDWFG